MFSPDIIVDCPHGGECQIDVERIKQEWHDQAVIYCWEGIDLVQTFRLIEYNLKGHNGIGLKVTINREDAIKLINDLGLIPKRDMICASATFYRKSI